MQRLLRIGRAEQALLFALWPMFLLTAASSVVLATTARALLLSTNDLFVLPVAQVASAAFTVVVSTLHVGSMRRAGGRLHRPVVYAVAAATLAGLRLVWPTWPGAVSLVMSVWVAGTGYVLFQDAWGLAGRLLTTREGKRLYPILAATATAGAATGGVLVQGAAGWLPAEDLVFGGVALLGAVLLAARRADAAARPPGAGTIEDPAAAAPAVEVTAGIGHVLRHPLLVRLAGFAFMAQAASVLVDYQFSGEMKASFGKEEMAAFLGRFSLVANVGVVVVSLALTGRLLRRLGVGTTLAASTLPVAAGSLLYGLASVTGAFPGFWPAALTAMAAHVGQHGTTRSASQLAVAPLDPGVADSGRGLIDGVVVRLATVAASLGLLAAGVAASDLAVVTPFALAACAGAAMAAVGVDGRYRQALMAALRHGTRTGLPVGDIAGALGRRGVRELEGRLVTGDPEMVIRALDLVRELRAAGVRPELLDRLACSTNPEVARAALAAMRALGRRLDEKALLRLLRPSVQPELVLEAFRHLPVSPAPAVSRCVADLVDHPDPAVSAVARLSLLRHGSSGATVRFQAVVQGAAPTRELGSTCAQAVDFARSMLSGLDDPSPQARAEAVRAIAALRLPVFVPALTSCLADRRVRTDVTRALVDLGEAAVPGIRACLADPSTSPVVRVAAHRVLESIGLPEALGCLLEESARGPVQARSSAAAALWRACRSVPPPAREDVRAAAAEGVRQVAGYAVVEAGIPPAGGPAGEAFASALTQARHSAERRVLLLLGLLHDRTALYRASLHYRSQDRRARANAIELIEQHVRDPELAAFTGLVEMRAGTLATLRVPLAGAGADPEALLRSIDPWLAGVWKWARDRDRCGVTGIRWEEPLDRAFALRMVPSLRTIGPEALARLAEVALCRDVAPGEAIFEAGDAPTALFLVLDGRLGVIRGGREVARLGPGEPVGEVALFHGVPYGSTLVAVERSRLVEIPKDELHDLLDLYPEIGREVVRMIATRLARAVARHVGDAA